MSKNILVAIDLADMETSNRVIAAAVEQWEQTEDPALYLMTVVPDIVAGLDWRYAIRGETGGSEEWDIRAIVKDALARLNQIAEEQIPDGLEVNTIARHGSAYEQVLTVAEEIDAHQIVVGAHRDTAGDFLIGSNTARIVRHAKCSVSVVRG